MSLRLIDVAINPRGLGAVARSLARGALFLFLLSLAFLVSLAGASAGGAASTRVFSLTWEGVQSEAYQASDSTPFDEQRAGWQGCIYSEKGDFYVPWRNIWRVAAVVRSGHVSIKSVTRLSGPVWRGSWGYSEIKGERSAPPPPADQSFCGPGNAGTFDCNAYHKVAPLPLAYGAKITDDKHVSNALDAVLPGFLDASASYSGPSPSRFTCAQSIGTDTFPGGFISKDFYPLYSDADILLRDETITTLKFGQHLKQNYTTRSIAWTNTHFPSAGDSCKLVSPDKAPNDESCRYVGVGENSRIGTLIVQRTR